MPNGKLNGYFKWVALLLSIGLSGAGAFFVLKSDVRVVEANIEALADKVDVQYQAILRELKFIRERVR
ncbi:hypothetical protein LCGC14_0757620 [marine sediment metagenome]|uniref:Uncharacterized protein n=1 Tax=marine sediment metagenome TaxID=412755 RepID=A0A0F9QLX3_9ZZZZ